MKLTRGRKVEECDRLQTDVSVDVQIQTGERVEEGGELVHERSGLAAEIKDQFRYHQ